MIAITFALPAESSGLVGLMRKKKRASSSGGKIVYGKIDNQSIAILHTGVGRKSCERKIDSFLRTERPRCLISSGFAGAAQVGDTSGEVFAGGGGGGEWTAFSCLSFEG